MSKLKTLGKFLISITLFIILGIGVLFGQSFVMKNSQKINDGESSHLDETEGTTALGIPWEKTDTQVLDSKYAFSYKYVSGVTTSEIFGFTHNEAGTRMKWPNGNGQGRIVDYSTPFALCKITGDDMKGTFGIIYHNVGVYHGKVISLKITVTDWVEAYYDEGEDNYPFVAFVLNDIYTYQASYPYMDRVQYMYEFFDESTYVDANTYENVEVVGHETLYDIDNYQRAIFEDNIKKIYFSTDSDLVVRNEYVKSYEEEETDDDDQPNWASFTFEGSSFKFRIDDPIFDFPFDATGLRWSFNFGMSADTFLTFGLPEVYASVDGEVENIVNKDSFNYEIDFYVPMETNLDGYYSALTVTDNIDSRLKINSVTVTSDNGISASNYFNSGYDGQRVYAELKNSTVGKSESFYNTNYKIVVNCSLNGDVEDYLSDIENGFLKINNEATIVGTRPANGGTKNSNVAVAKIPGPMGYTVKYIDVDSNEEIKDAKVVTDVSYGDTIIAASVKEDIDGYTYNSASVDSITLGMDENVISLYYKKRSDLSYTVQYKDIKNRVIDIDRVVNNAIYGEIIKGDDVKKELKGYKFDHYSVDEIVIGTDSTKNVITVFYDVDETQTHTISYTIEFYKDDVLVPEDTLNVNEETQVLKSYVIVDFDLINVNKYDGYKYSRIDPENYDPFVAKTQTVVPGSIVEGSVIKVYYVKRTDLKAEVNFIERDTGNVLKEKVELENLTFEQEIKASEYLANIDGYKYEGASSESINVGTGSNVINLYYSKRNDLSYVVKHLSIDETFSFGEDVVSNVEFGTVVKGDDVKKEFLGYKVDHYSVDKIVVGTDSAKNVITVYYDVDESQTYSIGYTIEFYKDDVLVDEDTVHVSEIVYVLEEYLTVDFSLINVNKYDGYKYSKIDPEDYDPFVAKTQGIFSLENKIFDGDIIKVYYVKRTDLKAEINFVEKDTGNVLKEKVELENLTFEQEIKASEYLANIDGYKYEGASSEIINVGTGSNVITLYYAKRDDLKYKINYFEFGTTNDLAEPKVVSGKKFQDVVTASEEVITINGFNYSGSDKTSIILGTNEDDNVINLYYTRQDGLSYSVKYIERESGKEISAMKTVGGKIFGDIVEAASEVIFIKGFVYNGVSVDSITIGTDVNELIVYYIRQTGLSYEVNYFEKGTTIALAEKKIVGGKSFEDVVYADGEVIEIEGYKYDSVSSDSIVIGMESNVINVYYIRRDDLKLTFNYKDKDTGEKIADSKTYGGLTYGDTPGIDDFSDAKSEIDGYEFWIADEGEPIGVGDNFIDVLYKKRTNLEITINYIDKEFENNIIDSTVVKNQEFKKEVRTITYFRSIPGYVYDSVDNEYITIGLDENVINFYYKKNTKLSYTVNYYDVEQSLYMLADEKLVENKTFEEEINPNTSGDIIDIDGYVFDHFEINGDSSKNILIVDSDIDNNVIDVYYRKRTDLTYTIKHFDKDTNTSISEDQIFRNQTLGVHVIAYGYNKDINGYVFDSYSIDRITIGTGKNVIIAYYTKRDDLSYTVNYWEEGLPNKIKESKIKGDMIFGTLVSAASEVVDIDGYVFSSGSRDIVISTDENVIDLYYTRRNGLKYTVNYLDDETNLIIKESKTYSDGVFDIDIINTFAYAVEIEGYTFLRADPTNLNIQLDESKNIINIYYKKRDDLSYTVNYLDKDSGEAISNPKIVKEMVYGDEIKAQNEVIKIYGYDYVGDEEGSIVIGTGDNVINLYYELKDATVVVRYVDKDSGNYVLPEEKIEGKVFDEFEILEPDNVEDKYQLVEKSDNYKGEMTEDEIVVTYTYELKTTTVTVHHYIEGTEEKLSDDVVMYDKVDRYYTTFEAYDIDSKWELAVVPTNKNGILTVEPIEVIYYYRKKAARVTVHYYEDGTVNKLSEDKIIDKRVDDEYETEVATDVPIKYELDHVEGEVSGLMTEDEIVVTYYYRVKDSQLIVRHWDKATGEKILDDEVFTEKVDFEYKLTPSEIEGYDLIEHSGNETGSFTVETQYVDYYYSYKSSVVVKYVDKNTGEVIEEVRHDGHEGDEVIPEVKNIDGYVLVEKPDDDKFDTTKEEKEVIYYYVHVSEGVVEKHIDVISGDIIYNEVHTGNEGDSYKIDSKENAEGFEKYDLVEDKLPDNAEGVFTKELIEIVYYYNNKARVIVKYVDRKTEEEIAEEVIINGHEGDKYETEAKEIDDYKLVESPEDSVMEKGDNEVVYYYIHDSAGLRVRYIDKNTGEEVFEDALISGSEGDPFHVDPMDIDGYDLIEDDLPDNVDGLLTIEETVVTYYYIKRTEVVIKYVDKVSGDEIDVSEVKKGHEGDEYTSSEKKIEGYDLVEEPENKNGTFGNDDIEIVYYYAKPAEVVVNYIDKDTNLSVEESDIIEGHEGDEYKTEAKNLEFYKIVSDKLTDEGVMTVDDINKVTEINYYYVKKEFNLNMDKKIVGVLVNGTSMMNGDGEIAKVEVNQKNLLNSEIIAKYVISVDNDLEIEGSAVIEEQIPNGMVMRQEENTEWKVGDKTATLVTEDIKPGEKKTYEVTMRWVASADNIGTLSNIATVTKTSNAAGFDEVTEKDNQDMADLIVSVATGSEDNDYTIIYMVTLIGLIVIMGETVVTLKKNN